MNIQKIKEKVDGVPHMTFSQAEKITSVILENRFSNLLELGFRHGVSTCYMAGALDELGGGHITTIDLVGASKNKPNVNQLLESLGLTKYATVFFEPTSYIWRLMKMLEEDPTPRFDFCYLDGAHDWATDGFAFFLVDRLLKPGGLIIFDDLDWTYELSPSLSKTAWVRAMPQDERTIPQVRKVFELLVQPLATYGEFEEKDGWAFARKLGSGAVAATDSTKRDLPRERIVVQKEYEYIGLGGVLVKILRKLTKSAA